ncbi:MAG: SMEK domain-containing protein [Candidatus Thiodiazotropha sp.]
MKAKLELENDLRDVVSRLMSQVSMASKQTRTDINLASEDAWIPILREVFQAPKLENLNRHQKNYPGIDLGDTENRICFQVTATTNLDKVKDSVTTFIEKQYYNTFDDLYVFTLVKRQKTYSQEAIDKIVGETSFHFSTNEHIIDPELIVEKITSMRFATQQRLLRELKGVAGDIDARINSMDTDDDVPYVFVSNLAPVTFPELIYSAVPEIDKDGIWESAKEFLTYLPKKKTTRSCLYLGLELAGYSYAQFVLHEKKIFTFQNLEESSPFSGMIDEGTIESFDVTEFFNNEFLEYENVFKQLLKSNIQATLSKDEVYFRRKDRLFLFMPKGEGDTARKVTWKDKRKATRTVYDQIKSSKDEYKIYAHRHFGFDLTFTMIENEWYCMIYPSWLFTYQLKRTHLDNQKLVSDKKKLEKNHSVRDHIRFVSSYLGELTSKNGSFVKIGSPLEFEFKHSEIVDLSDEESLEGEDEIQNIE